MAMDRNFRSALGGFNRSDVVNFIEEASINFEKESRKLKDENEKLQAQIEQLQQEKGRLSDELAKQAKPEKLPEAPKEPSPQPEETAHCEEPDKQFVPDTSSSEQELAAYRRAEAMERSAKKRAAALCRQINDIVEKASGQFDDAGSDIDALMQDLSISLRRLTDAFAEFKLVFDDTREAFHKADLLDTDEKNQ